MQVWFQISSFSELFFPSTVRCLFTFSTISRYTGMMISWTPIIYRDEKMSFPKNLFILYVLHNYTCLIFLVCLQVSWAILRVTVLKRNTYVSAMPTVILLCCFAVNFLLLCCCYSVVLFCCSSIEHSLTYIYLRFL